MIVNFQARGVLPGRYSILDAETGKSLDHLRISYADDEAGYIRYHKVDAAGHCYTEDGVPVSAFEYRPIRIIPRSASR